MSGAGGRAGAARPHPVLCCLVLSLLVAGAALAGAQSGAGLEQHLRDIRLPPGFRITVFADQLAGARSLARGVNGTIFVGTRDAGNVYAVADDDGDGRADRTVVIASGLRSPNGVAFRDGALYVAEISRILRFDHIEQQLADGGAAVSVAPPVVVVDDLPTDRHHGWKFIGFGPDGMLYVPIGAPCNVCLSPDERHATITRMRADGTGFEIYARGVRNSVGFDWHPQTGELWFTDNGRDLLGDDLPPDELNRSSGPGQHFGFPYLHGATVDDPRFAPAPADVRITVPARELGPHVAALGMRFYSGAMFPDDFRGDVLIAEHGSWNRSVPIGYRIMRVHMEGNRAVDYRPLAEGWLQGRQAWGRPVDLLVLPDGSVLVSDDRADAIYRIAYG